MEVTPVLLWSFVGTLVLFMVLDLSFLHRRPKAISTKSAALQSLFWVLISVLYGGLIFWTGNEKSALEFFSTYVTEKSLSVDNIFVILLIFRYFRIDEKYYHKVLLWGVLGAVVARAGFIFTGSALVEKFEWILYLFGAFLVYSSIKIFFEKDGSDFDPEKSPIVRIVRRYFSVSASTGNGAFFVRENGKYMMTILFLTLLLIEFTDLIFAVDSIPAAFAITRDSFVIYTSNIFAIMGLRAMFFLISGIIEKFWLLPKALAIILFFIGGKMLLEKLIDQLGGELHLSIQTSFIVIILTLLLGLLSSLVFKKPGDHSAEKLAS